MIPTVSPFSSPVPSLQKQYESSQKTVNYSDLNEVVVPVSAAVGDVVHGMHLLICDCILLETHI